MTYNAVDDEDPLETFRTHFGIAIDALTELVQRGEEPFYLNLLDELERIKAFIEAFERNELRLILDDETNAGLEFLDKLREADEVVRGKVEPNG